MKSIDLRAVALLSLFIVGGEAIGGQGRNWQSEIEKLAEQWNAEAYDNLVVGAKIEFLDTWDTLNDALLEWKSILEDNNRIQRIVSTVGMTQLGYLSDAYSVGDSPAAVERKRQIFYDKVLSLAESDDLTGLVAGIESMKEVKNKLQPALNVLNKL